MLNYLWAFMILTGILYASFTGNLPAVTEAALDSAQEAVSLCITMAGVLALWVGLMRIAEHAGVMRKATDRIYPLLHFLFPRIPKNHPAMSSIAANCIANFFGLGWAATPAGIQAMKDLAKLENELTMNHVPQSSFSKDFSPQTKQASGKLFPQTEIKKTQIPAAEEKSASTEMCAFLVLNISSVQLIPVTIIAYRSQYGSPNPSGIIGAAILATTASTAAGIAFIKIMSFLDWKRGL
ncbi:MAG: nucleoside recognition protein [Clostridiales bacterium]|nr:nucleoside recognition protein [Clostridiales bacterium]